MLLEGGVRGGAKGGERHGEPVGASGVFIKMKSPHPECGSFKSSCGENTDFKHSAYLNVSLFSRLNLERSSFTFWNLYSVTLCFQKL